ncbi:transporter [Clostridium hydrogeniformans]|uniref:YkvI family membrane protein n=1 Tax=Clostridium hydrogeniformans TaxID=349933 RepID=UPI000482C358|nr:transporter [Clostridium hydrogeniformans]
MKKGFTLVFQCAAVFIGTIVGAGLASGKEITQFFTSYGFPSFLGIIICGGIYILIGGIISTLSIKYNLNSYNEFITFISPGFLGKIIDIITGLFLLSGASIILAGSGALLNQYFGVSKWIGILLMAAISILTLLKGTSGLIKINSFIVPSLITVIITIFTLYLLFYRDMITINHLTSIPYTKSNWFLSTLLYAGFNLLCSSGVLVPLSKELKKEKHILWGVSIGALVLTLLCIFINIMLMLNQPYINQYEVPLLYITNRFGKSIQIALLIIIWCEMFSTEVSDIYSIAKTLEHKFKIPFKRGIFIIVLIALPISQIGFTNLITVLYPLFGGISLIFMAQLLYFFFIKDK